MDMNTRQRIINVLATHADRWLGYAEIVSYSGLSRSTVGEYTLGIYYSGLAERSMHDGRLMYRWLDSSKTSD